MKIDKTTSVSGGGLYQLDLELGDLFLALDPAPDVLLATVRPTTVSILHMFIDSFDPGAPVDPDPVPDPTEYYGVPSAYFGFGGALGGVYNTCYPLSGTLEAGGAISWHL